MRVKYLIFTENLGRFPGYINKKTEIEMRTVTVKD